MLTGGGRALIVNDAFGNAHAHDASRLMGRVLVKQMGVPGGGPGVPRIVRWVNVNDLAALKRFAGTLAAIPDLRLMTVSHGDPVTSDPAAALRAIAVMGALTKFGIPESSFSDCIGKGNKEPCALNDRNPANMKKNRRVEIYVLAAPGAVKTSAPKKDTTTK